MAWIIFLSLWFIIKDISHPGLPLHLVSDGFTPRGCEAPPLCFLPSAASSASSLLPLLLLSLGPASSWASWGLCNSTQLRVLSSGPTPVIPPADPSFHFCVSEAHRLGSRARPISVTQLSLWSDLVKAWSSLRSQLLSAPTRAVFPTFPINSLTASRGFPSTFSSLSL